MTSPSRGNFNNASSGSDKTEESKLLDKENKIFINKLNDVCGNFDRFAADVIFPFDFFFLIFLIVRENTK